MGSKEAHKLSRQTATNIINAISRYPRPISGETANALIACISENSLFFPPECRCALIDSINNKSSHNDIDEQRATVASVFVQTGPSQSLNHIENYLTHTIWKRLRAVHVNREAVFWSIAKLLAKLGLHRPMETFWIHLLNFIQWATDAPIVEPWNERDTLKALWAQAKSNMPSYCDGPTEYPANPTTLMETHPHIYLRAYVGNEQPIRPPSRKDIHSLDVLKQTSGCRSTKATVYQDPSVILQRHHYSSRNHVGARKAVPATPPL